MWGCHVPASGSTTQPPGDRVVFGADLTPPQIHLGFPKSPGSLAVLGGMKMMLGAWRVPTPGGYTQGG